MRCKLTLVVVAFLAAVVLQGCASHTAQHSKNDYYFNDDVITIKVETALSDRSLQSSAIVVETADRIVSLSGSLASQAEIETATHVARSTGGVQAVKNKIRLADLGGGD